MFTTYVLMSDDNILTPGKAFVSLSLIENVSWAMSCMPNYITEAIDVSILKKCSFKFSLLEKAIHVYWDRVSGSPGDTSISYWSVVSQNKGKPA